jgi:cell division protein FtsB
MNNIKDYCKTMEELAEKRASLERIKKARDVLEALMEKLDNKIADIEAELTKEEEEYPD